MHTFIYLFKVSPGSTCVFISRVGPTSSKHYPLTELDWLVRAKCHHICLQHTQTLVPLCHKLGWLVNREKSKLDPKQVFNFVGYQFTRKGDTSPQVTPPSPKMVAGGKQCASRSTIKPTKTFSVDLYRRIKRRVGCSLKQMHCKGNLVPSRKQATHKLSRTKGSLLTLKELQDLTFV